MREFWVVFDGQEPDSAVIGIAETVEDILAVIGTKGSLGAPVEVAFLDSESMHIKGPFRKFNADAWADAVWAAHKHDLTSARESGTIQR